MSSFVVRAIVLALSGAIVIVSAFVLAGATVSLTQTTGVVVGPGVYFRPSGSWADVHFLTEQTFLAEVKVSSTHVVFDGVTFTVEKTPRGLPRADVLIATWTPGADHGSRAIQFIATSDPSTQVWFNVTGLRPDALYQVYVDGILQPSSFSLGSVSFSWSIWSSHTLEFITYIDTTPPTADAGGDRTAEVNETLTFDGSGSVDDTLIVRYQWTFGDGTSAEGMTVQHSYAQAGDYFAALTVWDATGHSTSETVLVQVASATEPPTPDSLPPASVNDLRLVEWGADYAVLEWTAPGDDGVEGLAAVYDARVTQAAPFNESNYLDGQPLAVGPPRTAGTTERLNVTGLVADTRYWFALRSSDEVPNWSPLSNVVELRTLSSTAQVPTISSVFYDQDEAQLEVVFSQSMNQTSVEQAVVISPDVSYNLEWVGETHLKIRIQTPLAANSSYFLVFEPHAADIHGTPFARNYTYGFRMAGAQTPNPFIPPPAIPVVYLIVMLAGLAGLAEGVVLLSVLFTRNRRKMRRLQDVIAAQVIRAQKMRERMQYLGDETILRMAARPGRRK